MKVSVPRFFRFCSQHEGLIRALTHAGDEEVTEQMVRGIIQRNITGEEGVDTIYRNLVELQILVPLKTERNTMLVAQQLVALVRYLVDEARPATPQMIQGYINSLSSASSRMGAAIETGDTNTLSLMLLEVRNVLARIIRDVEETQDTVIREVMAFKVDAADISIKTRFARIVYWLRNYAEPMAELVRVDGPMDATFADLEKVLQTVRSSTWQHGVEQSLGLLKTVTRHSWHVFDQCLKELRPLYDAMVQANRIAAGAAHALEKLTSDRLKEWDERFFVGVPTFRLQNLLSDNGLFESLRRIHGYKPRPRPELFEIESGDNMAAVRRHEWLRSLPEKLEASLPVPDLCAFLIADKPDADADDIVNAIASIYYERGFTSRFGDADRRHYELEKYVIGACPLEVLAND